MSRRYHQYLSHRGLPLIYTREPQAVPVLTIENYLKWYRLELVMPDGSVKHVDPDEYPLPDFHDTEWYDHVPHPNYYQALIAKYGFSEDDVAYEAILGRFVAEVLMDSPTPLGDLIRAKLMWEEDA